MDPETAPALQLVGPRTIGTQLRQARLRLGLGQIEASAGICSGGYLSRVERGERQPSPEILAQLVERLTPPPGGVGSGVPSYAVLHAAAAAGVAEAADHWLAYPTDRGAFGRLVDAVDWWRRTSSTADLEHRRSELGSSALDPTAGLDEATVRAPHARPDAT